MTDSLLPAQSDQVDKITPAFRAAQAAIGPIVKKKEGKIQLPAGGSYSYKYADLPMILDALDDVLAEHGLSHQCRLIDAPGGIRAQTVIRHDSGQHFADGGPFYPATKAADPKTFGAAASYGARYGIARMFGLNLGDTLDTPEKSSGAGPKKATTTLVSEAVRDQLFAKIQDLPDAYQKQIGAKLREKGVVWTQLSKQQHTEAVKWYDECKSLADAETTS